MNAVLFVAFLWMMNAVFLVVHMGFALFCGGNAGSQKGSVVFAILHGKCVVLWFALLNRFIVVPMFARTLISCFVRATHQDGKKIRWYVGSSAGPV